MDLPFARKPARGVACLLSSQIMSRDRSCPGTRDKGAAVHLVGTTLDHFLAGAGTKSFMVRMCWLQR